MELGWVEGVNEEAGLALIKLGETPPQVGDSVDEPFELIVVRDGRKVVREVRPGHRRFSFGVIERYGSQCAVCELNFDDLLEAAHICPWAAGGTDDPRNGLRLCALHHRAFDAGYWAVEPDSLRLVCRPGGPQLEQLGITRQSLEHLRGSPSPEALSYAWERRWSSGRHQGDLWVGSDSRES